MFEFYYEELGFYKKLPSITTTNTDLDLPLKVKMLEIENKALRKNETIKTASDNDYFQMVKYYNNRISRLKSMSVWEFIKMKWRERCAK